MDSSTRPSRADRTMTGPCSCSALVSDCRFSMLATRSPDGEMTSDEKVWIAGADEEGAAASVVVNRAANGAASKMVVSFIGKPLVVDFCEMQEPVDDVTLESAT